jgi:hypothetical protein
MKQRNFIEELVEIIVDNPDGLKILSLVVSLGDELRERLHPLEPNWAQEGALMEATGRSLRLKGLEKTRLS